MKYLAVILSLFFVWGAQAEMNLDGEKKPKPEKKIRLIKNVEVQATYVKDNANFIYMDTDTERLKIKKKELTEEGVKQILQNKESKLTLFIPEQSIVNRTPIAPKEDEL